MALFPVMAAACPCLGWAAAGGHAGLGWAGLGSASLHFICSTTQKHSLNIRVGIGILSCLVKTWKLNGTNELASLKCKTTIKEIKNAVIPRSDSRPSVQIH